MDSGFGKTFAWDVSLLDGYNYEFLSAFPVSGLFGGAKSASSSPSGFFTTALTDRLRGKFDSILIHGYASGAAWAGMYGAWRTSTPIVVRGESHDRGRTPSLGQWIRRQLISRWMRRVSMVVAIGTLNRQMWLRLGVPEAKIRMSPYAIDNDRFRRALQSDPAKARALRASWGVAPGEIVFLFSGKLSAVKAPDLLLAAFASLPDAARAHLVFVGSGPLQEQLLTFQRQRDLRRVHFSGFVNQSEIPHYYRAADVLVLPSRAEPWGLVVNEAMACGTPCVVSDVVGAGPDLVEGFGAGCVFPANDEDALRRCLETSLDPEVRQRWCARLDEFSERISLDHTADQIAEAVRTVSCARPTSP